MVDIVQKEMTHLWADTGDILQPSSAKIASGWAVETVPRQWWNWMQNRVDTNVAYLLQKGVPEWSSSVEYIINKSYVQHLGVVYKCIQTHTNVTPVVGAHWVKAFSEASASSEALRVVTPAANTLPYFTGANTAATTAVTAFARSLLDDADATTALATLGAQPLDATLTALAGVTTAANKLVYATGPDAFTTTDFTATARGLLAANTAADVRTLLDLVKQTSLTDTTADVLGQGAFGLGHIGGAVATGDLDDPSGNRTGFYVHTSGMAGFTPPAGQVGGLVANYVRTTNALLGQATQVYTNTATVPRMWIRSAMNNTFGAWAEVWTSSNLVKQASATDTTVGALLVNGAWGLGGSAGSDVNPNTITNSCFFRAYNSPNMPDLATYAGVHIERESGGRAAQIAAKDSSGAWFHRVRNSSGVWQPWATVWDSSNQLSLGTTAASARGALGLVNSATINATSANTASQIVQRDASGNFSANQITAAGGSFTPWIELRNTGGTPHIDFSNDGSTDYDARLWLSDDDTLTVSGTKLRVENDVHATGWLRTDGQQGWYSHSYGGGIHMTDSTWVRVYGGKKFLCAGNEIQINGANPLLRMHSVGGPTRSVHATSDGNMGFLDSNGAWAAISKNDRWFETGAGYRFGEFARGNLYHSIDANGNRFVNLTNWDGGGVHVIHAPGSFVAFGPNGDNNHNLGWGFARWANVFAANGTINTSDARKKTPVREMTTDELNAAKQISDEIGIYQWLESIEEKGEAGARLHSGQTVQRIMAILEEHNLEPMRYAFICYDKWDAAPTTYKEDGTVDVEGREAGDLYSLRYDQLSMFLARGLAQRQTDLEKRLAALEKKLK